MDPRVDPHVDRSVDLLGKGRRPDLLARLSVWAASVAADEAAAARARERWLRRAAEEEASFAGVLLDLAERSSPVIVGGRGGRRHRGVVRAVGVDFVGLRTADGSDVLLTFTGIASVRPEPRADPPVGDRPLEVAAGLAEVLAAVVEDRPRVLVVTLADADGIAGELRTVGQDVLGLRLDGPARPLAYVPLASVAEIRTAD